MTKSADLILDELARVLQIHVLTARGIVNGGQCQATQGIPPCKKVLWVTPVTHCYLHMLQTATFTGYTLLPSLFTHFCLHRLHTIIYTEFSQGNIFLNLFFGGSGGWGGGGEGLSPQEFGSELTIWKWREVVVQTRQACSPLKVSTITMPWPYSPPAVSLWPHQHFIMIIIFVKK